MAPEPQPPNELNPLRRHALQSTALATLLAALVILTLLGHNRLTDWDEGIYAQVSRQILSTQHFNPASWLVLHWNTGLWLEKPPLTFWITAIFYKLFGVSEFTARLGSALSAIALVALLHYWLLRTRDTLTAWISTVILLSTFGFLHIARVGETDTLLSFGCLLALIGLTEVLRADRPSSRYPEALALGWYLYWIGFAIALMSKGAASGGLVLTLIVLLLLDPTLRHRLRAPFFLGLLLFLFLVLPWHLYLLHRFGHLFIAEYLNLHVIGRVTHQYDGHITHWWYYLRVLLFSAPPWVLLYPIAVYTVLRRRPEAKPKDSHIWPIEATTPGASSSPPLLAAKVGWQDASLRPFAVFALIQIIAFSCVQTRLPHYVAPAYAPLSALVAIWIATRLHAYVQTHPAAHPKILRLQFATALAALWILTALLTAHPRSQLHSPRLPSGVVTPNNRETTALLKQVFLHPSRLVAATPGPLLDGRSGTYNPIPTVLFYANRPVQQVELQPLPANAAGPANATIDIYTFDPIPLAQALTTQPRLLLIARSLVPQIPAGYTFQPIASSPTLELGLISRLR
jgi:4-amino-4-deoxy-L-arabinose transferase-like glycosyltransferase